MCHLQQQVLTGTGKIWRVGKGRKIKSFVATSMRHSFSTSTIEVFNMHGVWPSPSMLPTMVHDEAFCII